MRLLKWMLVSSLMGLLAACASSQATTAPLVPTDALAAPSSTPPIAATVPGEPIATARPPTESPTAAPLAKSTFIFLWEPG